MATQDGVVEKNKEALLQKRDRLQRSINREAAALKEPRQSVADVIDAAVSSAHDHVAVQLLSSEQRELAQINAALQRIEEGKYGICQKCKGEIHPVRLRAMPFATLCINCQVEEEKKRNYVDS